MTVFRRRRTETENQDTSPTVPAPIQPEVDGERRSIPRPLATEPAMARIPVHVERALITLTTKMQHCVERLDTLERRLDELAETIVNVPSHSDILEVRMHSAKLAAELARSTVELRGEIGMASDEARRAARAARNSVAPEEPSLVMPVDVDLTEVSIDLTDQAEDSAAEDHLADRRRKSGGSGPGGHWSQSA